MSARDSGRPDRVAPRGGAWRERLRAAAGSAGSLLCLGIDPLLDRLPAELRRFGDHRDVAAVPTLVGAALDGLAREGLCPAAFKPNVAYFACHDRPLTAGGIAERFAGADALAAVIALLRERHPTVPIILDAKRGDIARTSAAYADEAFTAWQVDAVTVAPWMGDDSVDPFLSAADARGGGVYLLARTSNPGAARLGDLVADGRPVWHHVATLIGSWAARSDAAGAVVGATAPTELASIAGALAAAEVPLLIPGVGRQGGSAQDVLAALAGAGYPLHLARVNVSSGALFPWGATAPPQRWREVIAAAVVTLHRACALPAERREESAPRPQEAPRRGGDERDGPHGRAR